MNQPTVETLLKDQMQSSPGWLGAWAAAIGELLFEGIPFVTNIIFSVIDTIFDVVVDGFDTLTDLWDALISGKLLGAIIPGLDASIITTGQFAMEIVDGLVDALTGLAGDIVDAVDSIVEAIIGVPGTLSNLTDFIGDVFVTIWSAAGGIFTGIMDVIEGLTEGLLGALTGIPVVGGVLFGPLYAGAQALFDMAKGVYDVTPMYDTYANIQSTTPNPDQPAHATDRDYHAIGSADGTWAQQNLGPGSNPALFYPVKSLAGTGVNLTGSNSATANGDSRLITAVGVAGDNIRGERWALGSTTRFRITCYVEYGLLPESQTMGFIFLRDDISGKYMTVGAGYVAGAMGIFVHKWTTSTTFGSIAFSRSIGNATNGAPQWLAIEDDGTNLLFSVSYNGQEPEWYTMFSEARTTYLTSGPGSWGHGAYCSNASFTSYLRTRSMREDNGGVEMLSAYKEYTMYRPVITNKSVSRVLTRYSALSGGSSGGVINASGGAVNAGDLIVIGAFNAHNNTIPALPSGWTDWASEAGTLTAYRIGWMYSQYDDGELQQTTGWTSADLLCVGVWRGATPGVTFTEDEGTGAVDLPTFTLEDASGVSWGAAFVFHRASMNEFPTSTSGSISWTRQLNAQSAVAGSLCAGAIYDSNGGIATNPAGTANFSSYLTEEHQAVRIELKAL